MDSYGKGLPLCHFKSPCLFLTLSQDLAVMHLWERGEWILIQLCPCQLLLVRLVASCAFSELPENLCSPAYTLPVVVQPKDIVCYSLASSAWLLGYIATLSIRCGVRCITRQSTSRLRRRTRLQRAGYFGVIVRRPG
jgi:hypothetical protein